MRLRRYDWKYIVGLGLIIVSVILIWPYFIRPPTTVEAANTHFDHLLDGDIDAIWNQMSVAEQGIEGMNKQLLRDFHSEHIKPFFESLKPSRETEIIYSGSTSAQIKRYFVDHNGNEIQVSTFAHVIHGRVIVGAIETLVSLASEL